LNVRAGRSEVNASGEVARDEVARSWGGPADRIVRPVDVDAVVAVCDRRRARRVGADVIPGNNVVRRRRARDLDPVGVVARDDVPCLRRGATDDVAARAASDSDAVAEIAERRGARGVGADVVADDLVSGCSCAVEQDAVATESVDDEPTHDRAAGGDGQAVGAEARTGAVQRDERRAGVARGPLRPRVEDDGIGDVR
jgi:hypothetical protein